MPKVSVIIPTFNRERFVIEAVESVLHQTFRDFEVIVVDDGSTDNTRSVLEAYGKRIIYVYQKNSGVSAARNAGIKAASGEWVAFLDSDDEWMPDYLATQMAHAREFPRAVAHITNSVHAFPDGEKGTHFAGINVEHTFERGSCYLLEQPFCFIINDSGYWFLQASVMRRDVLLRAGLLDEALSLGEDLDIIGRMALHGPFTFCREVLVRVWRREEALKNLLWLRDRGETGYETFGKVYSKFLKRDDLSAGERITVAQILARNRRALGNLLLKEGRKPEARQCYKKSLSVYPSLRGLIKYLSTFLPQKMSILFVRKENYVAPGEDGRG